MDVGAAEIVNWIASSTTSNLNVYSPVFYLIGGLVLAFVVITFLISLLTRGGTEGVDNEGMDFDDGIEI